MPTPYRIDATFDTGLVWFRRDLRLLDHTALHYALRHCRQVWCLFVFDTDILEPLRQTGLTSDRRVDFIHRSVQELDQLLRQAGSRLLIRHGSATHCVPQLATDLRAQAVFTNHDYEPAAQARDASVREQLQASGCAWFSFKDQVIFERDEILTGQHRPFSVFTPYKQAWLKALTPFDLRLYPITPYLNRLATADTPQLQAMMSRTRLPSLAELGFQPSTLSDLPLPAGVSGAQHLLDDFRQRLSAYQERRDFPARKGPSYLSVHLRFGTLSIRALAREAHQAALLGDEGAATWLSELIWREFYFMILHHHPRLAEGQSFKPEYDRIQWEQGEQADAHFAAWCAGQTGYPLVDAAMRQLQQTGYMHNRLRMVTASFLVKDLGIDWRRGERHFAEHLNDFDFAANNGGWQWSASSGCDAQPYFRIFNPITQSEKFDAEGRFIRRYLPELARLPSAHLHAPWKAPATVLQQNSITLGQNAGTGLTTYPLPLVAHDTARRQTLARYAVIKTAPPLPR